MAREADAPIRTAVLDTFDRDLRNRRLAIVAAVAVEVGFLAAFLLLADFGNRLHLLLFIATITVYSIAAFALLALGAHVSRCTLRVLRALEMLERGGAGSR